MPEINDWKEVPIEDWKEVPIEKPPSLLSEEQRVKEFGGIRIAPPKWIEPVKTGLETAGLIGGGLVGGAVGLPLGPPGMTTGSVAGAGLGYAAGKEASKIIERLAGGRKPQPIQPVQESLVEAGKNVLTGAATEVGGGIASKVVSGALTPVKQLIKAPWGVSLSSPESQELRRIYQELKIPATPSDFIPSSKTLSIVEGVLGYRPVSGDVMLNRALQKVEALNNARIKLINKNAPSDTVEAIGNRIRTEANDMLSKYTDAKGQKLTDLVNDFTNKMGISGRYAAGEKFSEVMTRARGVQHGIVEDLYAQTKGILPLKGQDIVPLSSDTVTLAKELMRKELSKPYPMQDKKLLGILQSFGGGRTKFPEGIDLHVLEKDPLLRKVMEEEGRRKLTWEGMKETRSDLLDMIREIYIDRGEPTKKSGIYTAIEKAIDKDMATFAEKQGGDLWTTYSKAREATKSMHELFDIDVLKIMRKDPEDILGRVINKGEVSLLKQIREAGGEEALIPLRQGFFKQVLDSSTVGGILSPKKLGVNLNRVTPETLSELATPQQSAMLNNIVKRGEFFSKRTGNMKTVEFLETLSGADSPKVVNAIIKPNNAYLVKVAKKLLSPERLKEIQSAALEEKIFLMSGTGNYLPVSSSKAWGQYETPMKELLSPQSFHAVTDFLKAGQNMSKVEALAKNASQTGQILLGSQIGSEILRRPWRAPMILGVPWLVAKIYTNPRSVAYLTRALKVDPVSPEAISLFTKAVTLAGLNLKEQMNLTEALQEWEKATPEEKLKMLPSIKEKFRESMSQPSTKK